MTPVQQSRYRLRELAPQPSMSFAEVVREGLAGTPKELAPRFFYDALGSRLFDAICLLPEYYPTRAEAEILVSWGAQIVESLSGPVRLVELGSGSSEKTVTLIDLLVGAQGDVEYVPIDVSASALESASGALLDRFPTLQIEALATDYMTGLAALAGSEVPSLVLFLGSSVGNLDYDGAIELLSAVRGAAGSDGALLLGTDLKKDRRALEAAYDDSLGLTAAFNKNLLLRINRELGGHFDLRAFRHEAVFEPDESRMAMYLVSTKAQEVAIDALDMSVTFAADERIFTEASHKYDDDDVRELAAGSGLQLVSTWRDAEERFQSNLLVPRDAG